jgi:hypothetical protein
MEFKLNMTGCCCTNDKEDQSYFTGLVFFFAACKAIYMMAIDKSKDTAQTAV